MIRSTEIFWTIKLKDNLNLVIKTFLWMYIDFYVFSVFELSPEP